MMKIDERGGEPHYIEVKEQDIVLRLRDSKVTPVNIPKSGTEELLTGFLSFVAKSGEMW
jgi:hypothetical protein